jgi:DNA-directed RNA polymerase specialized sigma subunit
MEGVCCIVHATWKPMSIEYLNNKVFEELILRFKKTQKSRKKNPVDFSKAERQLADAFYILADNIIRAFKFQLIDRDDMMQEGAIICLDKLHCFDPNYVTESGNRSKAFNYFTTCILNHFRQLYRTAKNFKQFKERYFEFLSRKNQDRVYNLMAEVVRRDYDD